MKKILLSTIAVAVLSSTAAQAASTGLIQFEGELTATTCNVIVDGQAADATVILPTVGTNQLTGPTQTAGSTGFVMALSQCAGTLETASAFFEAGSSVDLTTGRLVNVSGGATGVSLQLLDASATGESIIKVGSQTQRTGTVYKDISGGSTDLPYIVRYYAEDATTAGSVISSVVYSIQYQ